MISQIAALPRALLLLGLRAASRQRALMAMQLDICAVGLDMSNETSPCFRNLSLPG
jgi:hypothetical protein